MEHYHNVLREGDALDVLTSLPDAFVQVCVTSPPYYGLRSYLPEKHADKHLELGQEETPEHYIERLVAVFREVKRVLRKDGTAWINLGDSYGTRGQAKQLLGLPWRVAFALQDDGWILRSDIIWQKPNCMPESVTDRCTKSHEYLFLLAKNEHYYYDHAAILEPLQGGYTSAEEYIKRTNKNPHYSAANSDPKGGGYRGDGGMSRQTVQFNPAGRNKRSVWTIPTTPLSMAHFATFPPKLIEPCVLAGSSPRACNVCSAPWQRVVMSIGDNKSNEHIADYDVPGLEKGTSADRVRRLNGKTYRHIRQSTGEWQPLCHCPKNDGSGKCIILDPFAGAGTTLMVAIKHGRNYLGIELNPAYVELAEQRIAVCQPNLWTSQGVA